MQRGRTHKHQPYLLSVLDPVGAASGRDTDSLCNRGQRPLPQVSAERDFRATL